MKADQAHFTQASILSSDEFPLHDKIRQQVALLDYVTDSVAVTNADGRVVFWNKSAEELTGLTADRVLGKFANDLDDNFDFQAFVNARHEQPDWGYQGSWESRNIYGQKIWVQARIAPILDDDDTFLGVFCACKDISREVALEQTLESTNKIGEIGGWEYDVKQGAARLTDEVYRIFGIEPREYMTIEEGISYIIPEHQPIAEQAIHGLLEYGEEFDLELQMTTAMGKTIWVHVTGNNKIDDKSNGHIYGTVRNIDQYKNAVLKMEESDRLFRLLFNNVLMGAIMVNLKGEYMVTNKAAQNILGYSEEEMKHLSIMKVTHPDDLETDRHMFENLITGEYDSFQLQKRYISKKGSTVYCNLTASAIKDREGNIIAVIGLLEDITEQRKAESALRELNRDLEFKIRDRTRDLEDTNKEMEAFSYMISHDLNTPLRSIDIFSDLLTRKHIDQLDEKALEYLKLIRSGASEMRKLLDDLLEFFKVRSSKIKTELVDIEALINQVIAEEVAINPDKKVQTKINGTLPKLLADGNLLQHAFSNLLSNSFKYSKPGKPLKLSVTAKNNGKEYTLAFTDNGIGFEPKYNDRVFKPFERLVSSSQYPGSGLGLAIVERAIERHGGKAWAEGEPDKGTTIYLTLPK